jgi:hypothetical protein
MRNQYPFVIFWRHAGQDRPNALHNSAICIGLRMTVKETTDKQAQERS